MRSVFPEGARLCQLCSRKFVLPLSAFSRHGVGRSLASQRGRRRDFCTARKVGSLAVPRTAGAAGRCVRGPKEGVLGKPTSQGPRYHCLWLLIVSLIIPSAQVRVSSVCNCLRARHDCLPFFSSIHAVFVTPFAYPSLLLFCTVY